MSADRCGSISGRVRHRNLGEPLCAACREAWNVYNREYRARVRAGHVPKMYAASVGDRILANVLDVDGCWIWQGGLSPKGYGRIRVGRRMEATHRSSYEAFVGPIPEGLTVDHLCFVRACVNPEHLRLLTHSENASNRRPRSHAVTPAGVAPKDGRTMRSARRAS